MSASTGRWRRSPTGRSAGAAPTGRTGRCASSADGAPVRLKTGYYGFFVAHRRRFVSLLKDLAPEDVTLDAAVALLERRNPPGG